MKFRLSTALLIFGFIAVCTGWVVDRQRWEHEREELRASRPLRDEKIIIGSSVWGGATSVVDAIDELVDDPAHRKRVQSQCVSQLLEIYEHQNEIEFSMKLVIGEFDARIPARDALHCMDCDETDRFFEVAKSLKEFHEPEHYPELHDTDSREFRSLRDFISDTIAIKDQIYVRGFENDPRNK